MILHEIFRVVSRLPRYISCYIAENRFSLGQWSDSDVSRVAARRMEKLAKDQREKLDKIKTMFNTQGKGTKELKGQYQVVDNFGLDALCDIRIFGS